MNIKVESNVTIEVGDERITLNRNEAESLYSQLGVALGKTVVQTPGFIPNHLPRMVARDGTISC